MAVKLAKRLITGNLGPKGELDTDRMARALLEHRNTPDPQTGLSPAQIIFGRQLRGFLPRPESGLHIREEWMLDAGKRAEAFAKRQSRMQERLEQDARDLGELDEGQEVAIQDPPANGKAGRWCKSGTVIEKLGFDAYNVRVHGSRALTKRNRCHLRKIVPFIPKEKLVPTLSDTAKMIQPETVLETEEKFVAVQPPRSWQKLTPEPHRHSPAGKPGENIVTRLRAQEAGGAAQ